MIRDSLMRFLKQDILPLYDSFDPAHSLRHVRAVMDRCLELGRACGLDEELCAAAAAYHDIGLRFGREDHHLTSGRLLAEDERLTEWFDPAQIALMREAVEDHRASAERPPRSRLGMALADADREYSVERILARTLAFGHAHYPEFSADEQIQRAFEHVSEKYGKNGYLSFYLDDARNETTRKELLALLADPDAFRAACEALGGMPVKSSGIGYDLEFLPNLHLRFFLWEGDEEFAPTAQILFSANFPEAFAAEDRVVVCEYVIGKLRAALC